MFPEIRVPQNGWFMMENPIKMDALVVPLFSETSIFFMAVPPTPPLTYKQVGFYAFSNK